MLRFTLTQQNEQHYEYNVFEAITFLLCVYALWPMYVFTMAILRAHEEKQVSVVAWILAAPIVFTALVWDIVLNFTILAILTLDFPEMRIGVRWISFWKLKVPVAYVSGEWTFSQRLNRLVLSDNWRCSVARWVAVQLLDPYDPSGKHIK